MESLINDSVSTIDFHLIVYSQVTNKLHLHHKSEDLHCFIRDYS